jgi:hypothetical protein
MDRMNLSLDQIMASKPKPTKVKATKKAKPAVKAKKNTPVKAKRATKEKTGRSGPPIKKPNFQLTAVKAPKIASASIFTRLGNGAVANNGPSGSLVLLSKLNRDITASDVAELVGRSGETRRVELKYDNNGRSLGMAEVLFAKQGDAVSCVKLLNGVTLDGRAMEVKLANKGGNKPNPSTVVVQRGGNVRVGLFGTAGGNGGGRRNSGNQKVTLVQPFGNNNGKPKGGNGNNGRRNSNDSGNSRGDSRNGGRNGSAGGERKPKAPKAKPARAPRTEKPVKTSADLDAEMDAYMASK